MKKQWPIYILFVDFWEQEKQLFQKKMAIENNALHLNADEWCIKLFSKDEYENNWSKCFDETVDFLWKKAKDAINDNIDVVFDMGFWNKSSRDLARKRALDFGANSLLYYIYAPDNILKERISKRDGTIAENNVKNFDSIKKHFEEPDIDEDFIKINNF